MLRFKIVTFDFFRFVQSGFYLDFFIKKNLELFVKKFLIYATQFLGEKYLIEFLTKKIIDSSIFNVNKLISITDLFYTQYFISLLAILFVCLSFFNIIFIF